MEKRVLAHVASGLRRLASVWDTLQFTPEERKEREREVEEAINDMITSMATQEEDECKQVQQRVTKKERELAALAEELGMDTSSLASTNTRLLDLDETLEEEIEKLAAEKEKRKQMCSLLESRLEAMPDALKDSAEVDASNLTLTGIELLESLVCEREKELGERKKKAHQIADEIKELWKQLGIAAPCLRTPGARSSVKGAATALDNVSSHPLDDSGNQDDSIATRSGSTSTCTSTNATSMPDALDVCIARDLDGFLFSLKNMDALIERRQLLHSHIDLLRGQIAAVRREIVSLCAELAISADEQEQQATDIEMAVPQYGGLCKEALDAWTGLRDVLRQQRLEKFPEMIVKTFADLDDAWDKVYTCVTEREASLERLGMSYPVDEDTANELQSIDEREAALIGLHGLIAAAQTRYEDHRPVYSAVHTIKQLQAKIDAVTEEELNKNRGGIKLKITKWKAKIKSQKEIISAWENEGNRVLQVGGVHFLTVLDRMEEAAKEKVDEERKKRQAKMKEQLAYESRYGSVPSTPKRRGADRFNPRTPGTAGRSTTKRAKTRCSAMKEVSNLKKKAGKAHDAKTANSNDDDSDEEQIKQPDFEQELEDSIDIVDDSDKKGVADASLASYSMFQVAANGGLQSSCINTRSKRSSKK